MEFQKPLAVATMIRNGEWLIIDLLFSRKRQREQEIAEEEAAKKKKEWEKEWEVRFVFK